MYRPCIDGEGGLIRTGLGRIRFRWRGHRPITMIFTRAAKLSSDDVFWNASHARGAAVDEPRSAHTIELAGQAHAADHVLEQAASIIHRLYSSSAPECAGPACVGHLAAEPVQSVQSVAHCMMRHRAADSAVRRLCDLLIAARA
ncbi:MAG: hypothetical protein JO352_00405 [Chloroflexi bacterium]|nr:hypothetical protein [Chloroflexota bacterium]